MFSHKACYRLAIFAAQFSALVVAVQAAPNQPPFKDAVGFTQLAERLGNDLPTGANVSVSQTETSSSTSNYGPDFADTEFAGKSFTLKSGPTGVFGHATLVGEYLYGLKTGTSPGITSIDNWEIDDWLQDGFLRTNSNRPPRIEKRDLQNHSWRGSFGDNAADLDALRRFDFSINRDDYVAVVAMSNNSESSVPKLLPSSYNAISVGLSNGTHAHGLTVFNGFGRVKPEIVAPLNAVSFTTPVVTSSAALLVDTAKTHSVLANARHSESVKALLLAGATKAEFPSWDRTVTRPLDEVYGAGELNIARSFEILLAGEQVVGGGHAVSPIGWDFTHTASLAGGEKKYFFDVPVGESLSELSIVLAWNAVITDGIVGDDWGDPLPSVPNLDLQLYKSNEHFSLKTLLDESLSTVDNVEHIYLQDLAPGRYAMVVTSDTPAIDYSLAWYSASTLDSAALAGLTVPEPSAWTVGVIGFLSWLAISRRQRSGSDLD